MEEEESGAPSPVRSEGKPHAWVAVRLAAPLPQSPCLNANIIYLGPFWCRCCWEETAEGPRDELGVGGGGIQTHTEEKTVADIFLTKCQALFQVY